MVELMVDAIRTQRGLSCHSRISDLMRSEATLRSRRDHPGTFQLSFNIVSIDSDSCSNGFEKTKISPNLRLLEDVLISIRGNGDPFLFGT